MLNPRTAGGIGGLWGIKLNIGLAAEKARGSGPQQVVALLDWCTSPKVPGRSRDRPCCNMLLAMLVYGGVRNKLGTCTCHSRSRASSMIDGVGEAGVAARLGVLFTRKCQVLRIVHQFSASLHLHFLIFLNSSVGQT